MMVLLKKSAQKAALYAVVICSSIANLWAETQTKAKSPDACRSLLISVGRFMETPQHALAKEEKHRGTVSLESVKARLKAVVQWAQKHEFARNWILLHFPKDFDGSNASIERALSSLNSRMQISQELKRLEDFIEKYRDDSFELIRTENPQAFEMINASPHSWQEWWNLFRYVHGSRPHFLPTVTWKGIEGMGVVLDSKVLMGLEDKKMINAGLQEQIINSTEHQYLFMPEHMLEVSDIEDLVNRSGIKISEYKFELSPDEFQDFEEIANHFRTLRKHYDQQNGMNSSERLVVSDDQFLAQTMLARGISVFATYDQKLFNGLAVKNGKYSQKTSTVRMYGRDFLAVEVNVQTTRGTEYSMVVVNLGRQVNSKNSIQDLDPKVSKDQERSMSRRDFVISDETHSQEQNKTEGFEQKEVDALFKLEEAFALTAPSLLSLTSDERIAVFPAQQKLHKTMFEGYELSPEQIDYIQNSRRLGPNNGYLYEEATRYLSASIHSFMLNNDMRLVETQDGQQVVIFKLKGKVEKAPVKAFDAEDFINRIARLESLIEKIHSQQISSEDLSDETLEDFSKVKEAFQENREEASEVFAQLIRLPETRSFLGSIQQISDKRLAKQLSESFSQLFDVIENKQKRLSIRIQIAGDKKIQAQSWEPGFESDLSPEELNTVFSKLQIHANLIEEIKNLNPADANRILAQLKLISEGQTDSNVTLQISGAQVRDIRKTYLVVFQPRPNKTTRILGITKYTDFEGAKKQASFIKGRKASFPN